jgi:CheY-like chemotaxis protein
MDIMMPGMDGYAAIRAIRAMERFTAIPIIAVTGKVVPGERQRCLDAGANDYVPKPVDTLELLTAVGPWLPVRGRSRA